MAIVGLQPDTLKRRMRYSIRFIRLLALLSLTLLVTPSEAADQFPPARSDQVSGNQRSIYYTWSDWPWTDEQPMAEALCAGKVLVYWPPGGTQPPAADADEQPFYPPSLHDPMFAAAYDQFFRPPSPDQEGPDVQLIRDYMCDIVSVYESRVSPFVQPIRLIFARGFKVLSSDSSTSSPEQQDDSCSLSSGGPAILASYDPEVQAILLPLGISDTARDPCPFQALAHEVAHNLIHVQFGRLSDFPWLDEGGAEYLASLVFTENNYPQCYAGRYQSFSGSPYSPPLWPRLLPQGQLARSYSAYPFLHFLAEQTSDDTVIEMLKNEVQQGISPADIIATYRLRESQAGDQGRWSDYIQEVWGDPRYQGCGRTYPAHEEKIFTKEERKHVISVSSGEEPVDGLQCYAAEYFKFTTPLSGAVIYRLHTEEIYGQDGPTNAEEWFQLGAMVKTESNEWRQIDLTVKEFVQFELDTEGGNQDDITDRRATIFHHNKEVAIVFAVTPDDPDECEAKLSQLQGRNIGVHFGLNNAWQLKQLRIGEDDEVKRISVEGLLYLRAERKDNKLYLMHKTRHFWPNFSTKYYRKAMQQSPDGRFPFRSAKSMKLFLDTSCEFAGTQIFEVQHTDDSEELDQELIDPSEWDQKLEYTLKSTKLLLLDRPYRFRCDPSNFTNKTSALMMLGGGFASTAALMQKQAKWLNGVTGDGNWQAEWAENIKDLFVNTLSYGFGEDSEGQEKTIKLKFVQKPEENYLVVKVSDKLQLIYREVIR